MFPDIDVNDKGHLTIGGADAVDLADRYGTPLYVIDEMRIRDNYRRLYRAFSERYSRFQIFYACKANTGLAVMRILEEEGSGIDAVSPGEIYTSLMAGFEPERILYTGNNVTDSELRFAVDAGVMINVDSRSQLRRLAEIAPEGLRISFRVNPLVGAGHHEHCITGGEMSKFGIMESEAAEVYSLAVDMGFEPVGIHAHIGSGILDPEPFMLAVESLMDIAGRVSEESGVEFDFIDFGGGLGIPYRPEEEPLDIEEFASRITGLFREKLSEYGLGKPVMCLEPGRYIVGDASYLLTRVNTVKESYRRFAGVDAGFNTLLRPAMYGSYHHILVADRPLDEAVEEIDIAGNVCESGDLFARDRKLPEIHEGDVLAVMNAGAYAFSMASQYNSRPRPAEVLVRDGESEVVRERETFADLLSKQTVPPRLLKR
ncbi:diaminopimelate decarboxylase [Methanothermobacter wolfeii]|uniref:Diaminopimelate decarboxylase n=1 Tax=Methanothermobacter wolfeii TaxID=145261 RepID=A0A9E7RW89_METWO|nr:diaminopimelate decarboxylase [Methanothermobacter wolfeii]NLM02009.1 diaminopimelate decarboxylase [Methanothermobacter wolfeii]UXH31634.1 diaminopimelate decarboxylase [Methanothermobacter wolfeii]SCM58579.1 Diaminopimelate decarboxylase {ECO:0000255/HAMAP-Rule:MF_02120} [Methanothermobacter wolfeii]